MSLSTYMERLRHLDDLIRRKATGNLDCLARKLHLSKSHTVTFINEMRDLGFPVEYSRKFESYFYTQEGRLAVHLFEKKNPPLDNPSIDLSPNQLRKASGGQTFFNYFLHAGYIRMSDLNFDK